jgi:hypothetical protein
MICVRSPDRFWGFCEDVLFVFFMFSEEGEKREQANATSTGNPRWRAVTSNRQITG